MKFKRIMKLTCVSAMLIWFTFIKTAAQTPTDPNWIRAVAWTSDGSQIALSTQGGIIQVLSTTGQPLQTLQSNGIAVFALAWSPDGTKLASGGEDKQVTIWDITTGKALHMLKKHTDGVISIIWSPDGTKLASASRNGFQSNVFVWSATTGEALLALSPGDLETIAWEPSGQRLAISRFGQLGIWDSTTGKLLKAIKTPEYGWSIAWSPDGTKIASADTYVAEKSVIRIWDVTTGQVVKTLQGHTNVILSVSWSPDGSKLVSSSHDRTVRIWDVATGQSLKVIQATTSVFRAMWSPYGGRVAYGDAGTTPNTNRTSGGVQFVVPPSTLKDLQAITRKCVTRAEMLTTLTPDLDASRLAAFVDKVKAAGTQINPGCAADLIAVADILQKQ